MPYVCGGLTPDELSHAGPKTKDDPRLPGKLRALTGSSDLVRRCHVRTILVKLLTPSLGRSKTQPAGVNSVCAEQCGQVTRNVLLGRRREITECPGAGFQK